VKNFGPSEKLLTMISTELINVPTTNIEEAIQKGLRIIVEFFDVDRASFYEFLPDIKGFRPNYLWLSDKYNLKNNISPVSISPGCPGLVSRLLKDGKLIYRSLNEIPEDCPDARDFALRAGCKSGVIIKLGVGGDFQWVITIETLRSERAWSEEEVVRLKCIGEIFANAINRLRSDLNLRQAYSQLKELKDRLEEENVYLREEIENKYKFEEFVGQCEAIKRVLNRAELVAKTDSNVLILGETGTGKELLARAIHNLSSRKGRAMVKVNCASLPPTLIENELFGREKGAYTGALVKQIGRFEIANGSTIFLDEIGDLVLELQAKLLRILQEGEFERLGSTKTIKVDVRVIAASNRDLAQAVQEGSFREDLFYRLNVFPILMPPLRERREDIPLLVWTFIKELGNKMGKQIETISKKSMEAMLNYQWPGNVRELRNVIEGALILSKNSSLAIEVPKKAGSKTNPAMTLEEVERKHILDTLDRTGWRVSGEKGAAKFLGLKPTTLESMMKKLGIVRKNKNPNI